MFRVRYAYHVVDGFGFWNALVSRASVSLGFFLRNAFRVLNFTSASFHLGLANVYHSFSGFRFAFLNHDFASSFFGFVLGHVAFANASFHFGLANVYHSFSGFRFALVNRNHAFLGFRFAFANVNHAGFGFFFHDRHRILVVLLDLTSFGDHAWHFFGNHVWNPNAFCNGL